MSITVTLTFPSIDAAVRALRSLPEADVVGIAAEPTAAPAAEQPKKRGRPVKVEPAQVAPAEPAPEPVPEPVPEPAGPAEPVPEPVTIDDLRAAAVAAVGKVGREEVLAIARRYGAEKPTAVDQAKWADLVADLKAAAGGR